MSDSLYLTGSFKDLARSVDFITKQYGGLEYVPEYIKFSVLKSFESYPNYRLLAVDLKQTPGKQLYHIADAEVS